MSVTIIPQNSENRDQFATIRVAGAVVAPNQLVDGTRVVEIDRLNEGGIVCLTLEVACALAAALQSVAVYQMEQRDLGEVAAA